MTASQAQLDLGFGGQVPPQRSKGTRLPPSPAAREPSGVVYTQPWVADLILDLAGYRADQDLAARYAVEPSAGNGAFLRPMIRRLLGSLAAHGRDLADARDSIRAYELDANAGRLAAEVAERELLEYGASVGEARNIADGWVQVGDYLLTSPGDRRADLVVGNPPYIRYDETPAEALAAYRGLYPTMVGRGDIYVGFIEAGLRQLAAGGVLGFICADRWMRSAYGSELRRMISAAFGVEAVIEMHDAPAFENEVSAYPAVIIISRRPQGEVIVASAGAGAGSAPAGGTLADAVTELAHDRAGALDGFTATTVERWFTGTGPWPSLEPRELSLLQLLEARFGPLEDDLTGTKIGIGVATGADRVFITRDLDVAEPDRMVPLAMTADTRKGILQWSGHYLVDPFKTGGGLVDLEDYPRLRTYLEGRRAELEGRHIARRSPKAWYRTIDPVRHGLTGQPKLYFPDMKLTSHPVLDRGETYPHHNLYYLTSRDWDLEILGGLLISRIAQLFIEAYCVKMSGGTLRFQAQYLRRIRVPDPATLPEDVGERLRQAFRTRDADAATVAAFDAYGIPDMGEVLGC
jgi:adenine-specific DNA-methyltransferase